MRLFLLLLAGAGAWADTFRIGSADPGRYPEIDVVLEAVRSNGTEPLRMGEFTLVETDGPGSPATQWRRFRETGNGVGVLMLIDASGSMSGRPMEAVRQGLAQYVSKAREYDRVAVATVADEFRWEAEWSTPQEDLKARLEGITTRGSKTRLWDGVLASLTALERSELPARRRLVVISDGHDEGSEGTVEAVKAKAVTLRIPIDCIGISRTGREHLRWLEDLAGETGGSFRVAEGTEALREYVGAGIEELLDSPVATFAIRQQREGGEEQAVVVRWETAKLTDRVPVLVPRRPETAPPASESRRGRFGWWAVGGVGLAGLAAVFLAMRGKQHPTGALPPVPVPMPPPPPPVAGAAPGLPDVSLLAPDPAAARTARRPTQFAMIFPRPSPGRPAAWLHSSGEERFPIERDEFWIGALENNHLVVAEDETVSRNHACIRTESMTLRLFDNGSTNGTWVNGERVQDAARLLVPGDRIRIGRSTYTLERER